MKERGDIMKEKVEPRTLPGFMELLPQDQIMFNKIRVDFILVVSFSHLILQRLNYQKYYLQKQGEKQKNKFIVSLKEIQIYHCVLT